MEPIHENFSYRHAVSGGADPVPALISHRRERLAADCSRCCGLCCTALYFSKAEGFPDDKGARIPCAADAIRKLGFPAPTYVKISPARFTALCPDAA